MTEIIRNVQIPIPAEEAFGKFVYQLNEWWPVDYTWSEEGLHEIRIDPRKDGLCTEIGPYDFRCDWGRVTEFETNHKIGIKWQISAQRVPEPNPEKASDVLVVFNKLSDRACSVLLRHCNFQNHRVDGVDYLDSMDSEEGWDLILNCFISYCEGELFEPEHKKQIQF